MKLGEEVASKTFATNMFGRAGMLLRDPRYLVYLQHDDGGRGEQFGSSSIDQPRIYIEWLVMNQNGVTLGQMQEYCEQHNPKMLVIPRRPVGVVVRELPDDQRNINLDPGAEVLFSWKHGVEHVHGPDGEVLYER